MEEQIRTDVNMHLSFIDGCQKNRIALRITQGTHMSSIRNCTFIFIHLKHVVHFHFHVPVLLPTFSSSSSSSSSSRMVWHQILFFRTVCLDRNRSMVHQFVLSEAFSGTVMYTNAYNTRRSTSKDEKYLCTTTRKR